MHVPVHVDVDVDVMWHVHAAYAMALVRIPRGAAHQYECICIPIAMVMAMHILRSIKNTSHFLHPHIAMQMHAHTCSPGLSGWPAFFVLGATRAGDSKGRVGVGPWCPVVQPRTPHALQTIERPLCR